MENETSKQPQSSIKNMACNLMLVVVIFLWAYAMASFAGWEIDCRKWDALARWGVVWGGSVISILAVAVRKK